MHKGCSLHTKHRHQLRHNICEYRNWSLTHHPLGTASTHRGTVFPKGLKGSTHTSRSTVLTHAVSPFTSHPLVHPLCSGPSSHQASETVPAGAKATRHDPLLVAPQDQTPVTMPSLNCTLEGFLWPSWPSLLSLLAGLPFLSPSALPSHPTRWSLPSQLQRQSTWGRDSQNATHCALPFFLNFKFIFKLTSPLWCPTDPQNSIQTHSSSSTNLLGVISPCSSWFSQKAGHCTSLFLPNHLWNLHSAHPAPAPWPLPLPRLRLLLPGYHCR